MDQEIQKRKCTNYLIFAAFAIMFLVIIAFGFVYQFKHSFTTAKWMQRPDERTMIVDDLLHDYDLVGMGEEEIFTLLGPNDNSYGYFLKENRFIYYMGPERGLFSIDSEWLILDFSNGVVSDCFITTD